MRERAHSNAYQDFRKVQNVIFGKPGELGILITDMSSKRKSRKEKCFFATIAVKSKYPIAYQIEKLPLVLCSLFS